MNLHYFCLRPVTCRLSMRLKVWVLLYLVLYPGNLMLNQIFLNATKFQPTKSNPFSVSSSSKYLLYKSLLFLLYGAPVLSRSLAMLITSNCSSIKFFGG